MSLSDVLATFLDRADELDGLTLANVVKRLTADCAALVADYSAGEVAAICQRCGTALIWLDAERSNPDSRQNRHGRMRATLDLLDLVEAVHAFHVKGNDDALALMRQEVAAALRPLVDAGDPLGHL